MKYVVRIRSAMVEEAFVEAASPERAEEIARDAIRTVSVKEMETTVEEVK
jgi:hypothetical protein